MNSTQNKCYQVSSSQERMHWLDAMKALGITIIIAGHYTPPHFEYLYTFSVQMFFIMSGFLVKSSRNGWLMELKKIVKQLILPMIVLAVIYNFFFAISQILLGETSLKMFINNLIGVMAGDVFALAGLWFVYTLIIIRVLSVFTHRYLKPIIAITFMVVAIYFCEDGKEFHNAYINVLLAYPCFYIGELFGLQRDNINRINDFRTLILLISVGLAGTWLAYMFNGTVWMYLGGFGGNIGLFILGSLCGTMMCFGACKLLFSSPNKHILLIAEGTILILAFHGLVIRLTHHIDVGYLFYLGSVVMVIAFIPLIFICQRYFPILLGYRGCKK